MLTIHNFDKIKDANTKDWYVDGIVETAKAYIIQIHKKVGYWPIKDMNIGVLTINVHKNQYPGLAGYVVESHIQNNRFQTVAQLSHMRSISYFAHFVIDNHILRIIK